MRTKWRSGFGRNAGHCLMGNLPERQRAGTNAGKPTGPMPQILLHALPPFFIFYGDLINGRNKTKKEIKG